MTLKPRAPCLWKMGIVTHSYHFHLRSGRRWVSCLQRGCKWMGPDPSMPSAFSVFILSVKPGWLSIYVLGRFLALRSPAFPSHLVTTSLPTEHSTFHCRYSDSRLPDIASSPLFYPSTSEGSYLCIPLSVASAMPARSLPSLDHFRTTFCCLSFHLRDVTDVSGTKTTSGALHVTTLSSRVRYLSLGAVWG